jgi:hypothetical protein
MIQASGHLKDLIILAVLAAVLAGCAAVGQTREYTLADVQGFWWENCSDPAAQFAIQGNRYFGDFEGEFKAHVEHGVLRVDRGSETQSFHILDASPTELRLHPLAESRTAWVLRSCPGQ